MSDRELLDALSVIARRMGLIERGQRIAVVGDPRADIVAGTLDVPLCLAYGKYRDVRLCCTYAAGHEGVTGVVVHSWQNAMIGKSACSATSDFATTPDVTVHQCQLPTHHAGAHAATGADGVLWSWSGAPKHVGRECGTCGTTIEVTGCACAPRDAAAKGCMAWEWGTDGHKAGCMLRAGHEGPHKGLDADGKSIFTWPCPCYPDCTGHTVPGVCGFRVSDLPGALVCELPAGHEGDHATSHETFKVLTLLADPTAPRT